NECLAWTKETKDGRGPTTVELLASGNLRVENSGRDTQELTELRTTLTTSGRLKLESKNRVNATAADHPLYAKAFAIPPEARPSAMNAESAVAAVDPGIVQAQYSAVGP